MIRIHAAIEPDRRPDIPLAVALGLGDKYDPNRLDANRWADLHEAAPRLWKLTSLDEAQVVLYPYTYDTSKHATETAARAQRAGKPLLFFSHRDSMVPARPAHGTVFRTSIDSSRRTDCEYSVAAFCGDILANNGHEIRPRPLLGEPSVGFCGYVGHPWHPALYRLQGRNQKAEGLQLRQRVLACLRKAPGIYTRFIERTQFWGGSLVFGKRDYARSERVRNEFVDNLLRSDLSLCLRGMGNFSYRFYETLAAGRVPLFVNTDCVLPFDDEIDWKSHCVWVEYEELRRDPSCLQRALADLDAERFLAMQLANRTLWEEWLSPLPFYTRVLERAARGGYEGPRH